MLSINQALNILHLDEDSANTPLVYSLIDAIPAYIETTTGMSEQRQLNEPLCDTVSGFILTLWYYTDHSDTVALQRTIDNLLKCITIKARS